MGRQAPSRWSPTGKYENFAVELSVIQDCSYNLKPPLTTPSLTLMALMPKFSALRVHRGEAPAVVEDPAPQAFRCPPPPPPPPQLVIRSSSAPDDVCPLGRYAQIAQGFMSSLPSTCHRLDPLDVKLTGERPIAAGGFANIWEGTHDSRKIVLKSYRCYVSFDAALAVAVRCDYPLCRVY